MTALQEPGKRSFHFCIVNLVIGTLYCVKGNYEFGIARIIKSLEPESEKLESDTWFYAKRCLLALFEGIAKHMLVLKASVMHDGTYGCLVSSVLGDKFPVYSKVCNAKVIDWTHRPFGWDIMPMGLPIIMCGGLVSLSKCLCLCSQQSVSCTKQKCFACSQSSCTNAECGYAGFVF